MKFLEKSGLRNSGNGIVEIGEFIRIESSLSRVILVFNPGKHLVGTKKTDRVYLE